MHALGIDDAYHVERTLAEGRAGVTQLVTIEGSGPFVRKKIPTQLANRAVWAALADCESPRLPQVAATYEMPDCFVAVYDYIPGNTLEHVMASRGRLSEAEAVQVVKDVCEAVANLHSHGVIHCDVNPSNIIIAADGAHLIDFGIAQFVGHRHSGDTTALGTWGFAAPEQYGFAPVDVRSDVYSLAQLLGYLLTGISPDLGSDAFVRALDDSEVVPPALAEAVKRGSAFEPSARYQSVEEFSRAFAGTCARPNGPRMPEDAKAPHARTRARSASSLSWEFSERDASFDSCGRPGFQSDGEPHAPWSSRFSSSNDSGRNESARGAAGVSNKARIALAVYREIRDSRFLQCAILLAIGLVMAIVGEFLGSASGDPDSPFYMTAVMGMLLMSGSALIFIIDKTRK